MRWFLAAQVDVGTASDELWRVFGVLAEARLGRVDEGRVEFGLDGDSGEFLGLIEVGVGGDPRREQGAEDLSREAARLVAGELSNSKRVQRRRPRDAH